VLRDRWVFYDECFDGLCEVSLLILRACFISWLARLLTCYGHFGADGLEKERTEDGSVCGRGVLVRSYIRIALTSLCSGMLSEVVKVSGLLLISVVPLKLEFCRPLLRWWGR
jgi:hypothetical protein